MKLYHIMQYNGIGNERIGHIIESDIYWNIQGVQNKTNVAKIVDMPRSLNKRNKYSWLKWNWYAEQYN